MLQRWKHREKDSAATVCEEFCYRVYPVAYSGAQVHYRRMILGSGQHLWMLGYMPTVYKIGMCSSTLESTRVTYIIYQRRSAGNI